MSRTSWQDALDRIPPEPEVTMADILPSGQSQCVECGRIFDMHDDLDANEWYYGHDCDPTVLIGTAR